MSKFDRSDIAALLGDRYPLMAKASSDEWHALLNAETELDIGLDVPNGSAFDAWRKVLAEKKGWREVWPYSPERLAEIKARGERLAALERECQTAAPERIATMIEELMTARKANEAEKAAVLKKLMNGA
mgnify:CR=1 FL=1